MLSSPTTPAAPKCQGAAAKEWLAEREAELLPVPYFHVLYTAWVKTRIPPFWAYVSSHQLRTYGHIGLGPGSAGADISGIRQCELGLQRYSHLPGMTPDDLSGLWSSGARGHHCTGMWRLT